MFTKIIDNEMTFTVISLVYLEFKKAFLFTVTISILIILVEQFVIIIIICKFVLILQYTRINKS